MQIATVLKSNGTDGELLIGFKGFSAQDIDTKEPVFIEFDGLPVPYFIEKINPRTATMQNGLISTSAIIPSAPPAIQKPLL